MANEKHDAELWTGEMDSAREPEPQPRVFITIDRCPRHRDFWAVCIGDGHYGVRLTPSKCCGRWDEVRKWSLSERQLRDAAEEFIAAADSLAGALSKNGVRSTGHE